MSADGTGTCSACSGGGETVTKSTASGEMTLGRRLSDVFESPAASNRDIGDDLVFGGSFAPGSNVDPTRSSQDGSARRLWPVENPFQRVTVPQATTTTLTQVVRPRALVNPFTRQVVPRFSERFLGDSRRTSSDLSDSPFARRVTPSQQFVLTAGPDGTHSLEDVAASNLEEAVAADSGYSSEAENAGCRCKELAVSIETLGPDGAWAVDAASRTVGVVRPAASTSKKSGAPSVSKDIRPMSSFDVKHAKKKRFVAELVVEGDKKPFTWEFILKTETCKYALFQFSSDSLPAGGKSDISKHGEGVLRVHGTGECPSTVGIRIEAIEKDVGKRTEAGHDLNGHWASLKGLINGKLCGEVRIGFGSRTTIWSHAINNAGLMKQLAILLKALGVQVVKEPGVKPGCDKCHRIKFRGGFNKTISELREQIAKVREELEKEDQREDGEHRIDLENFPGATTSRSGPVPVRLSFPPVGTKDVDKVVSSDQDCPPPLMLIAVAADGEARSPDGGVAKVALPWTGAGFALGGSGFSCWKLGNDVVKALGTAEGASNRNAGTPDAKHRIANLRSIRECRQRGMIAGGKGGDAVVNAGCGVSLAGDGGNGISSGGAGGSATFSDVLAPVCCAGSAKGWAVGGIGGSACAGTGGAGGEATDNGLSDECPTLKLAIGGAGGIGLGTSGAGGPGGKAVAKKADGSEPLEEREGHARGGAGGPGTTSGGNGGDAESGPPSREGAKPPDTKSIPGRGGDTGPQNGRKGVGGSGKSRDGASKGADGNTGSMRKLEESYGCAL